MFLFVLPFVTYYLDDWLSGWHHGGLESYRQIAWDNFWEDASAVAGVVVARWLAQRLRRPIPMLHLQCPGCGFKFAISPKERMPQCPRCGMEEPP